MRRPRFRLRSLMILILVASLVLAGVDQAYRIDPADLPDLREQAAILVPFAILVLLKLGLFVVTRSRRLEGRSPILDREE